MFILWFETVGPLYGLPVDFMFLSIIGFMFFAESDMSVTFSGGAHPIKSCVRGMPSLATGVAGVSGSKVTKAESAIQVIIC